MTHRLVQENLEVLPLYGGGILKLVDHHLFKLGPDLLEDKWRVATVDECMKQVLCITQQETVGLLVELAYLLFDAT